MIKNFRIFGRRNSNVKKNVDNNYDGDQITKLFAKRFRMVNNPKIMRAMAYERKINRVQSIEREAEIESSCKLKYYK